MYSKHNQPNIKNFTVIVVCYVVTHSLSVSDYEANEKYSLDARFQNMALDI